jgi:hypothetical protein
MFVVSRYINGITLNPKEYILTEESGEVAQFKTENDAFLFLKKNGVEIDSIDELWDSYGFQIEREEEPCN